MNFKPFSLELNLLFPIVFTSSFDVAAMVLISALIRVACNRGNKCGDNNTQEEGERKRR
jgi:hypothetical protein